MNENKEVKEINFDLSKDLVAQEYFILAENSISEISAEVTIQIKKLLYDKNLSIDEKYNYLVKQILDEPVVKEDIIYYFLIKYKMISVFETLEFFAKKGYVEAGLLYDYLTNDKDIIKEKEKLKKNG